MKKKLLVSFSGGETSGYMLWWIINHWKDEFEILVVFANTGEENEETLRFIQKCSEYFKIDVVWVEGVFHKEHGKATTHKVVDYKSATRGSALFLEMASVYGIPNQAFPHCNRELKLNPIKSYLRSIGWKNYYTAIGIREDEIDRVNMNWKENKLLYPLVMNRPMNKAKINFWWSQQPFRLNLKGYQGNCKTCWKKSDKKLIKIAQENPEHFDSFRLIEQKLDQYAPDSRKEKRDRYFFFRNNRSTQDILELAKSSKPIIIKDDSANLNYQSSLLDYEESCDIFSMCGDN